jgi:hypothetical protein
MADEKEERFLKGLVRVRHTRTLTLAAHFPDSPFPAQQLLKSNFPMFDEGKCTMKIVNVIRRVVSLFMLVFSKGYT